MSAALKTSDDYAKSARGMEHNIVSRRSSRRENISNAMKKNALATGAHQSSKFKEEDVNPFSQPFIDWDYGSKHQIDDEHSIQLKSLGSCQKQQLRFKTKREDELVKHMSSLPSFLQRVEKQKSLQDKALNFGVLDWKRLEKWKYNERVPERGHRKISSSGNFSSMPSVPPGLSKRSLHRKQASADLHPKFSDEVTLPNCVQQSQGKVKYVQDSQTAVLTTVAGQQNDFSQKVKFSSRSYSELNNKSKTMERDQKNAMDNVVLYSKQVKGTSLPSSFRRTDHYRRRKTVIDDGTNQCPKYPADEPEHIVLLVPKLPPKRSSSSSTLGESRTSWDGELAGGSKKRFSDFFSSQELHLGESNNEIPHSCPLPDSVPNSQGMQLEVCMVPHEDDPLITPRPSNIKCQETRNSNGDCSVSVRTSNVMDFDTAESLAVNGRHSSPNRRFSFSLGRLSRSFSFKESLTVPKLSSTYVAAKSGPVISEDLASVDNTKIDKAQSSGRGWSSPFRRLLHPILKPKEADSAHPVQPLERDLHFASSESPTEANKPVLNEKRQTSALQALLQLTINNGLPFFKFVVGNSSHILAAAARNIPTSGKTDCSLIFRFYSVHEFKKKTGSWIGHGSRDKSSSLSYNIVGQMKISCPSDTVKEAVLYNVDIGQGDGSPEVLPDREIASIMVKDPAAEVNYKEKKEHSECNGKGHVQSLPGNICDGVENKNFDGTLVILPVGIHSLPTEGAPSSLIDRWKSGGLCDCGGWDIGCKLRVLTDRNQECSSTGSSVPGRIDLFNQGAKGRSQPCFSLAPLKDGFYSVEFNSSISLLVAFSICVAVITNQKLPDILDMNLLPEAEVSAEAMTKTEKLKNLNTILGQVPAKYVPSPPPSPAGRI